MNKSRINLEENCKPEGSEREEIASGSRQRIEGGETKNSEEKKERGERDLLAKMIDLSFRVIFLLIMRMDEAYSSLEVGQIQVGSFRYLWVFDLFRVGVE